MGYNLLINVVYWVIAQFTNHLLYSREILVHFTAACNRDPTVQTVFFFSVNRLSHQSSPGFLQVDCARVCRGTG